MVTFYFPIYIRPKVIFIASRVHIFCENIYPIENEVAYNDHYSFFFFTAQFDCLQIAKNLLVKILKSTSIMKEHQIRSQKITKGLRLILETIKP